MSEPESQQPRTSQHPTLGQLIAGRYRIERFLAQGGHGAVYVAEQLATEAQVAVKVLWPHVLSSEDVVERFELEAKVAGRVKSDFIVRILDAGVDEPTRMPFLVMELLEGESLLNHVKRHGPVGAADTATFIMQVAHGLDKAHGYVGKDGKPAPIVHRDLKPENLFLTVREDGLRVVKILDFGIAKVLTESVAMSQGIKGTPLYMAHEQVSGGAISARTDIWSLGLVAFFLLTGRAYWKAAAQTEISLSSVFAEVLMGPIAAPTERAKALGVEPVWRDAFDTWFLRCVNRNPKERFPTAGEAASALAEALLGAEWAATLPPSLASSLLARSGSFTDAAPSGPSESIPAPVASTTPQPVRPLGAQRSALLGVGAVVLAGVVYLVARNGAHSAPVLEPDAPASAGDLARSVSVSADAAPPLSAPAAPSSVPSAAAAPVASSVSSSGKPLPSTRPKSPSTKPSPATSAVTPRPAASRIYDER